MLCKTKWYWCPCAALQASQSAVHNSEHLVTFSCTAFTYYYCYDVITLCMHMCCVNIYMQLIFLYSETVPIYQPTLASATGVALSAPSAYGTVPVPVPKNIQREKKNYAKVWIQLGLVPFVSCEAIPICLSLSNIFIRLCYNYVMRTGRRR